MRAPGGVPAHRQTTAALPAQEGAAPLRPNKGCVRVCVKRSCAQRQSHKAMQTQPPQNTYILRQCSTAVAQQHTPHWLPAEAHPQENLREPKGRTLQLHCSSAVHTHDL
eukprot:1157849-Pelagomonas_calceolata.AAC.15